MPFRITGYWCCALVATMGMSIQQQANHGSILYKILRTKSGEGYVRVRVKRDRVRRQAVNVNLQVRRWCAEIIVDDRWFRNARRSVIGESELVKSRAAYRTARGS